MRTAVEAAFTHALDRYAHNVIRIRIRLSTTRLGVMCCRARLFPTSGHSLVASSSAASAGDAAHAAAHLLSRLLARRHDEPKASRRSARNHRPTAWRKDRAQAAA